MQELKKIAISKALSVKLAACLTAVEDQLMDAVLSYAIAHGYSKYTSTLKEAWRISISGLTKSLTSALENKNFCVELGSEQDYRSDPIAAFAIVEARRHRKRGVRLEMFLGLLKYYRQAYHDVLRDDDCIDAPDKDVCEYVIDRMFDRIEIGFCTEWSGAAAGFLAELQSSNRNITNEKNKYLTIFESLSIPVIIVDPSGKIQTMNHAASNILHAAACPGASYYSDSREAHALVAELPWIAGVYGRFLRNNDQKIINALCTNDENHFYHVSISGSLDISGKFSGAVVIIEDVTGQKKMERELERMATTDPLTGANNRRSFLQHMEKEFLRYRRYGQRFTLLMLDIDYFKTINDTHGHNVGDEVLMVLADESRKMLRETDIFGRWGGEEFVVLLPESNMRQALAIAERLRGHLAAIDLDARSASRLKFTVSIGVATTKKQDALPDDIIGRADSALYLAKTRGRNRVVSYESESELE